MLISHGPCLLDGPVTETRDWWKSPKRKPRGEKSGLRADLVARVKAEIAAGTYDTPDRFDAALATMARHLEIA